MNTDHQIQAWFEAGQTPLWFLSFIWLWDVIEIRESSHLSWAINILLMIMQFLVL